MKKLLKFKRYLFFGVLVSLPMVTFGISWALDNDWNRPNPIMDYAPQEVGIYDTRYVDLSENDCRSCHGDSTRDRHHYTGHADNCAFCHEPVPQRPEDWPDENGWPPQVPCDSFFFDCPAVERNCVAVGCHSWDDVETNGWHHNGRYTAEDNCAICHNRDLIGEFGRGVSFADDPPIVTSPLVTACENCHWEQEIVDLGWIPGESDPGQAAAGHPSTYDHFDPWGGFVGHWQYPLFVCNLQSTHMKEKSGFTATCTICHSLDDVAASFDPTEPENIRACERCHSKDTLHHVHMQSVSSWEAVGFHTSDPTRTVPTTYRVFTAQDMCAGCHGYVPPVAEIYRVKSKSARPGMKLVIKGNNFGEYQADSTLHIGDLSFDITSSEIKLWSNTKIKLVVPKYKNKWYKGKDFRRENVWVTVSGMPSNAKMLRIYRPCKCDLNKDALCDNSDIHILGADMNRSDCGDPGVKCKGDVNRDNAVDERDYDIFMEAYQRVDCGTM